MPRTRLIDKIPSTNQTLQRIHVALGSPELVIPVGEKKSIYQHCFRCDVDTSHPCSTCRQYEWECTFNNTTKKRGPPKGYIESLEMRLKKMEKLLQNINNEPNKPSTKRQRSESCVSTEDGSEEYSFERPHGQYGYPKSPSVSNGSPYSENSSIVHPSSNAPSPVLPTTDDIMCSREAARNKVIRYHGSSSGYYIVGNILSGQNGDQETTRESPQLRERPTKDALEASLETPPESHGPNQEPALLPTYNGTYRLRKINKFDEDMVFVRDKTDAENACQIEVDKRETIDDVVPRLVLQELVKVYFEVPHPTLPILDGNDYIDESDGRCSLPPAPLLTYAICLYACFLISSDNQLFKDAGLERDVIFNTLLTKAATLVRKEYLVPRVSNIQALILLCAHPTYTGNTHRCWIMAGMAVRMAQDLGLHRTFSASKISEEVDEHRKRLWYSVYITDRWCCAVMGRPLAIADSDCDIDLPRLYGTPEESKRGKDYVLFVSFVKLSGILGEVLRRIYSPKAKSVGYKSASMEQTACSLQRMLNEWFDQLPDKYRITHKDLEEIERNPRQYTGPKDFNNGGSITACYCAVVILLHRPFIALENSDGAKALVYAEAMQRCTEMAKMAIDIARVLPNIAITRFGWNFAAYSIYQAVLIHVYNCMSNDPKVVKVASEYVRISIKECVDPLTKDIPCGPPVVNLLTKLMSMVGIDENGTKYSPKGSQNGFDKTKKSSRAQAHNEQGSDYQPSKDYRSPKMMSVQHIMSDVQEEPQPLYQPQQALNDVFHQQSVGANVCDPGEQNSWLFGGPCAVTQATWQQLFSSTGAPFVDDTNSSFQCWENLFIDNPEAFGEPNNGLFMQ
ncbi:fungal-specific transcription factor domain-containing protein [Phycomyces nitens]|nr:fungal-specific transcription factor domain-containing protein [Phycomyces nitens]